MAEGRFSILQPEDYDHYQQQQQQQGYAFFAVDDSNAFGQDDVKAELGASKPGDTWASPFRRRPKKMQRLMIKGFYSLISPLLSRHLSTFAIRSSFRLSHQSLFLCREQFRTCTRSPRCTWRRLRSSDTSEASSRGEGWLDKAYP